MAKVVEVAKGLARIDHGGRCKQGIWVGLRWWQMLGSKGLCTAAYSVGVNGSGIQCDSVTVIWWMVLLYRQPINLVLDGVLPLHAAPSGENDLIVSFWLPSYPLMLFWQEP